MGADHVEPSFVEKLAKSSCARAFVLRVWVAVGFNADDLLDHSVNSCCCSGRLVSLSFRWRIRGGGTKPAETKSGHAYDDPRPHSPTVTAHVRSGICRHWDLPALNHARDAYGICCLAPKRAAASVNSTGLAWCERSTRSRHVCLPSLRTRLPSARHTESSVP